MRGTSKVIMGATLVMVVILAVVLALILVLLAELYCSLLLRRRHHRKTDSNAIPIAATQTTTTTDNAASASHPQHHLPPPPPPPPPAPHFRSIYAQGVLQAPSSFLLPAVVVGCDDQDIVGPKKLHSVLQIQTQEPNASPPQVGALSSSSSFISKPPQKANQEDPLEGGEHHLVYISNPIYETSGADTPFETPESSPSHLERNGTGSSEEDEEAAPPYTPPLTPMKKLPPAEAGSASVSLSLRDARSLDTSGSDSRSINNDPSSSSSASPCTSPSW
ncbi:hypothetical protein HN51_035823 [Arachis hypogaea]|uniref:protein ENL-like n=1 Tax=Arachis ipaensis TaxID=130454 RepID=UPI000A2B4977|nr:protein ENL-like [Arachis ipaensis]QHO01025.1 Transmembrane protein, putative [Arachis hypogaea]